MATRPSSTGSRALARQETIALGLLALLITFHLVNNWLWVSANDVVYSFDRMYHQVTSLAYYDTLRQGVSLQSLFSALTWSDYYPPLVHLLVTLFYALGGVSMDVSAMANSVFVILLLGAVYDIGRRLGGWWVGLLSAFVLSTFPIVFSMSRYLYIDFALLAWVAVNLALLLRADRFRHRGYSLLYGLSLGLGLLTKWTFAAFVAAPLLAVLVTPGTLRSAVRALVQGPGAGTPAMSGHSWRRLLAASLIGLAVTALWFVPNVTATAALPLGYGLVPLSWLLWTATSYLILSPAGQGSNLWAGLGVGACVAGSWYLTRIDFVTGFWLNAYGKPTGRSWGFRGYRYYLIHEQLSPLYVAVLLAALLILAVWRWRRAGSWRGVLPRRLEEWILLLWAVMPYIIFSIQVSIIHSRYIMPLLPPLAVAIALALGRLRPAWLRASALGVVAVAALFQFSALSFDAMANIKEEVPFLADGLSIQLPASGSTDSDYWIVPDVLQAVEADRDADPARLGIVVNEHQVHSKHFIYLVYTDYHHVFIQELATLNWRADVYPLLFNSDYFLISNPPPRYPDIPENKAVLEEMIRSQENTFSRAYQVIERYPWPDGREVLLYKRRFPGVQVADPGPEALMAALNGFAEPEDAVVVLPAGMVYSLAPLADRAFSLYPFPATGESLVEADLAYLADLAAAHDRLWIVRDADTPVDPAGMLDHWLTAHTYQADHRWYGPLQLSLFAPEIEAASRPPFRSSDATWEPGIALSGYRLLDRELPVGQVVRLDLQWSAAAPVQQGYKTFVHLLDDQGRLVAQRDTEPVRGTRPTWTWAPGEEIDDRLGLWLPPDLPDGEYQAMLGLYDPTTLERLPTCCPESDAVTIATIQVEDGTAYLEP
ncbi:MAG: glycosyltransferase family 39 protein [Anaerolineae bacterium]|nr:glycosyltransferase family 39 protein [Anaerolineae bacterium]